MTVQRLPNTCLKKIWVAIITSFILIGCQAYYQGGVVNSENRIILPAGPEKGLMDTRDLVFYYALSREKNRLTVSGTVEFTGGVEDFPVVRYFHLHIYFLDSDGHILERRRIFSAGHLQEARTWSFRRQLDIPGDTSALAFGYSGRVRDVGTDAPVWDFWKVPY
ncbi:hypothetical protein DENIS_2280 [Desulfonema ishimotonii]|uniref:Uncharacterized protein n=1 Tax=Desulfonema ishimotonii TaxID=45657 RepID=A0A401FWI0_9BACT|nr:hypothetical protein [Desulfonema ishimotonii]GBC61320.1 hypothetical protein DENIS_2280 [Desulfonema ishimotonii]